LKRVLLTRSKDDIERDRKPFEKEGFEVIAFAPHTGCALGL
jgi:uroporphyrinogen-III synthase